MDVKKAIAEIRKEKKRKFEQSIDLIINLKGIDIKRDNVAAVINIPNKIKDKKVCGFLSKKSELVRTILQPDFQKYKEKKPLKSLIKEFDFFIASAPLMPQVATAFGKVLGPSGKMPSPQLGILGKDDDSVIKQVLDRIDKSIKIRLKEPSVKIVIGKEGMKDEQIEENIRTVFEGLVQVLPSKRDNLKSVLIKTTMGKPVKVEI